jgi:hypothetical protein
VNLLAIVAGADRPKSGIAARSFDCTERKNLVPSPV